MSPRRWLGQSDRSGNPFLRGLTIGVLVGAAIAGSRIWRRRLRRPGRPGRTRPSEARPA